MQKPNGKHLKTETPRHLSKRKV